MSRSRPALAARLATLVLAGMVVATPAAAAQISAVTAVSVVKPVSISKVQDMDFGTLTFASFTGSRSITLGATGSVTCAADIVCSGTGKAARFTIVGTNKLTVLLSYTAQKLSNGTDQIPLTLSGPASVTMTNSGAPGTTIDVGGTLTVDPGLIGGVYNGTMTVTAEYQ